MCTIHASLPISSKGTRARSCVFRSERECWGGWASVSSQDFAALRDRRRRPKQSSPRRPSHERAFECDVLVGVHSATNERSSHAARRRDQSSLATTARPRRERAFERRDRWTAHLSTQCQSAGRRPRGWPSSGSPHTQHTRRVFSHLIDRWSWSPTASGRAPSARQSAPSVRGTPFQSQSPRPRHNSLQAVEKPCLVLSA